MKLCELVDKIDMIETSETMRSLRKHWPDLQVISIDIEPTREADGFGRVTLKECFCDRLRGRILNNNGAQ